MNIIIPFILDKMVEIFIDMIRLFMVEEKLTYGRCYLWWKSSLPILDNYKI